MTVIISHKTDNRLNIKNIYLTDSLQHKIFTCWHPTLLATRRLCSVTLVSDKKVINHEILSRCEQGGALEATGRAGGLEPRPTNFSEAFTFTCFCFAYTHYKGICKRDGGKMHSLRALHYSSLTDIPSLWTLNDLAS